MSKYPVGPKLPSIGTVVPNVPVPPALWLFYLLNCSALLVFFTLLIGMQFGNSSTVSSGTLTSGLLVLHYLFLAVATIWAIVAGWRVSRYLCILNTGGIAYVAISLAGYNFSIALHLLLAAFALITAAFVVFLPRSVHDYYRVLSGKLSVDDYQPYSPKIWKVADGFGTVMGYVGEIFIFFLAVFMILRFVFHE